MIFSISNIFYRIIIDPIFSGLRRSILEHVEPSHHVLDVACGTGALALVMACRARRVTGIDLSAGHILAARRMAWRRGLTNAVFELRDAGNLSCYTDKEFDLAVTSMAVHQFNADLSVRVLSEMKRIANRIMIIDYNHHLPRGWGRSVIWGIERFAGCEHYRNFRTYMRNGGIHYVCRQAGIKLSSEVMKSGGVFVIALSDTDHA
ncbi:MAG: class I SAM-dependent methyltransferase [Bacteroidales bacterium]|nr:class I SAM-dependent methyltransferase [Bacteroidales bacterium]